MASLRDIRRRIASVQNTGKITKAMEMVAAAKLRRNQRRIESLRPYARDMMEMMVDLATYSLESRQFDLLQEREVRRVAVVAMTGDRGLAGAFNANVVRKAVEIESALRADGVETRVIAVGRKAESYFKFRDYRLGETFAGFSDKPSYEDAKVIGQHVIGLFASGHVDKVELVYTRFITAGNQEVVLRPLVPLTVDTVAGGDGKAGSDDGTGSDYEFEPDPTTILETLLPRYVEARVYAALLNAAASEHAFRQRAMKSATDNAEELIKNLSITMNRARLASITTEIMEIVGGAEALSADKDGEVYIDLSGDTGFGEYQVVAQ